MTDRPILFSSNMVRALLAGTKTQTRRACKWTPTLPPDGPAISNERIQPGDRLWVRESGVQLGSAVTGYLGQDEYEVCGFRYAADDATIYLPGKFEGHDYERRRNSIHMPRWASRLTLTVTDVRVQRLQDISEADAIAEGLASVTKDGRMFKYGVPDHDGLPGTDDVGWPWTMWQSDPREAYRTLWNSINGPGAWDANPWVAAYTFTVECRNIDA